LGTSLPVTLNERVDAFVSSDVVAPGERGANHVRWTMILKHIPQVRRDGLTGDYRGLYTDIDFQTDMNTVVALHELARFQASFYLWMINTKSSIPHLIMARFEQALMNGSLAMAVYYDIKNARVDIRGRRVRQGQPSRVIVH